MTFFQKHLILKTEEGIAAFTKDHLRSANVCKGYSFCETNFNQCHSEDSIKGMHPAVTFLFTYFVPFLSNT